MALAGASRRDEQHPHGLEQFFPTRRTSQPSSDEDQGRIDIAVVRLVEIAKCAVNGEGHFEMRKSRGISCEMSPDMLLMQGISLLTAGSLMVTIRCYPLGVKRLRLLVDDHHGFTAYPAGSTPMT